MDMQNAPRMSPEELYTRMTQGEGVMVLDVRTAAGLTEDPYQIPGTRWLPLAEVVQQADTLPRQRMIVTYCTWHNEESSARVAQWLRAEGFEAVYVLQGGLQAWLQARYPSVPASTDKDRIRSPKAEEIPAPPPLSVTALASPGQAAVPPMPSHAHTFLAGLAQHYLVQQSLPARKELAVLFVDIADSTATILHQPPEVAVALIQRFLGVVTETALAHCGDVKDYEGDGALLYFESVAEATQAALAIREALAREQPVGQEPLRARLSLNVGTLIVAVIGSALRRSVSLIGPSINIASRLLKHIPPGGIIATEAVVERLRQEAPTLAQRFQVWDPCLVLKGVEEECVRAYHIP